MMADLDHQETIQAKRQRLSLVPKAVCVFDRVGGGGFDPLCSDANANIDKV